MVVSAAGLLFSSDVLVPNSGYSKCPTNTSAMTHGATRRSNNYNENKGALSTWTNRRGHGVFAKESTAGQIESIKVNFGFTLGL